MSNKLHLSIEADVTGIADDGSGVIGPTSLSGGASLGTHKPIFVFNTIPGETVSVTTKRKIKDGIQAQLNAVVKPSRHRVTPMCPYAGVCGGCKWQHMDYAHQLALKKALVSQTFQAQQIEFPLGDVRACPEPFYYRNRMDYVFGSDGSLGLKQSGRWFAPLDLSTCFLLSKEGVEIMDRVRRWARKTGLPFWDVRRHEGFFRYLVIREGKNTGERLVMLVTHLPTDAATNERMQELPAILGELATSVVWGVNPRITDLSIADEMYPLKGDPWLDEIVNGIRYRIHPNSFFQTNTIMASELQNYVKSLCEPLAEKNILDLYCGAGFFTLALAGARSLTGIELDPFAIENAKFNAQANNLKAEFFSAKAEEYDWTQTCPQIVILDPPRAGLHPSVIKMIRKVLPSELVYVSCHYRQLAKELPFFLDRYRIKQAAAFDLFPHTPHVEIVVQLERI